MDYYRAKIKCIEHSVGMVQNKLKGDEYRQKVKQYSVQKDLYNIPGAVCEEVRQELLEERTQMQKALRAYERSW